MMMNSKIFISCKEANHNCDKAQYKEASLLEKIKLKIHLAWCVLCRKYSENNTKLTALTKQKNVKLDTKSKEKIQLMFNKELAKYNNN